MSINYDNLGFHSKYYTKDKDKINLYDSFQDSVSLSKENILDVTSVIEFISLFYQLSDRTLIKGLSKSPWLGKVSDDKTGWDYYSIKDEYTVVNSELEYTELFIGKLETEISNYIKDKNHIGILLTGGMDSRVVAVLLKKILSRLNSTTKVTAFTWGMENSRDVIYSKIISSKYDWAFKNIKINANTLKSNIELTALRGCEFSPVHLHGIKEVSQVEKVDAMLAGSFGDSMGRGEYSGTHVSNLQSIQKSIGNRFYLLNTTAYKEYNNQTRDDINHYKRLFQRRNAYSNYEIEMLAHYMRRELNPCMSIINDKIPLFQCFASPEIFEFVLNTPTKFRNDKLYYNILKMLDPELLEIPWARTGRPYLNTIVEPDNYNKDYHDYGQWIRNDLYDYIKSTIFDGNIEKLNIFNMDSLKNLIKINKQYGGKKINRIDEILTWLSSFSLMIEQYNINIEKPLSDSKIKYKMNLINSLLYTILYFSLSKIKH